MGDHDLSRFFLLWLAVAAFGAEDARKRSLTVPDGPAPCVKKGEKGYEEPESLQSLLNCQFGFRIGWVRHFNERFGKPPTNPSLDKLDDLQRAEVREYLSRHPDRAHTDYDTSEPDAKSKGSKPREKIAADGRGATQRCRPAAKGQPSGKKPDEAFDKQHERTEKAMEANLQGGDPGLKKDLAALDRSLSKSSDYGRAGITQEGALDIVEFLECQQGGVSDDMMDLLNHVVRDGAKLQHDTMLRLKRAAREAEANGLELGVEQELQRWLLDPSTDPADDPNGPNPTAGPALN
jgi:hypothetical protein